MSFRRQVSRALDDEHRASLDLLNRVEQAFAATAGGGASDPALTSLLVTFGRALEAEVARHFDFEEREIFPRMHESGSGDLADLLLEEHVVIRKVAGELLPLTRVADRLDAAGGADVRRLALELVERLRSHIDKETSALVPTVEDMLDEDADRELAFAYAAA